MVTMFVLMYNISFGFQLMGVSVAFNEWMREHPDGASKLRQSLVSVFGWVLMTIFLVTQVKCPA